MAKKPLRDFPINKPASPDHLAGRDGAAPSSSGDGPSGKRGAAGETVPRTICFKCADRPPMPGYRVCAYCFEVPPSHDHEDESFACGCDWNPERYVMLNPNVEHDPTVVARPPSKFCVACGGTGRIKDRHHYLKVRRSAGHEAEGAPRVGYYRARDDEDEAFEFSEGGWQIESGSTGQPVGAPVRGVRGADAIWQQFERTLAEFEEILEFHLADTQSLSGKKYEMEFEALLIALSGDRLNDAATAGALGFSRKTFDNRDKLGRKTFTALIENVMELALTQKAPKGGRTMTMNTETPTIAERIAEHETRLAEVERQVGLPPGGDSAVEEAVDRFLADTLD
jgi:hypothetical protein